MELTPEELNQRLTDLYGLVSGDLAQDALVIPAGIMLASIKKRILSGKNSNGGDIGNYSQEPIYATKSQFVKKGAFKPQGKYQNQGNRIVPTVLLGKARKLKQGSKFLPLVEGNRGYTRFSVVKNNYEERTSMYLEHGYKQLRDIQSMQTNHVDSKYSGDLLKYYQMQKVVQAVLLGFSQQLQSDKRKRMEQHFNNPIYKPTQQEINEYAKAVNFTLRRLTQNTIEGLDVAATIE